MRKSAGVNGFGRFGLHLLKYWLDRIGTSNFDIGHINDDTLTAGQAYNIIVGDKFVSFSKYKVKLIGQTIRFLSADGNEVLIEYTNAEREDIPWIGKPDLVFECSGKNTSIEDCRGYLAGKTELVVISATSWDAEKTLVYGFNHEEFERDLEIISYGSCTVNAYVPLANFLEKKLGIIDSDMNVIHNIQQYKMGEFNTLIRKFCTVEKMATVLLPFQNDSNFKVNYTVIPYPGVSIIDFRFRFNNNLDRGEIIDILRDGVTDGELNGLYDLIEKDTGPEVHNCTTYSTVFIEENIEVIGDNVYLHGYFDNENSVNRFYDLVRYICSEK